jgi:DNA topoisomerase-1
MAKKSASSNGGKALVIVESPAKARTISKFLGRNYTVEASIGHIRDLPRRKTELKKEYQKEDWAYLGVNVADKFEPHYIVPSDKSKQVSKLKDLLKEADQLYLATDEDREGEAISWHLNEVLKPKVPVHRMVFHEITSEAIHQALENPRQIDSNLVEAQETRRILDRLYGYPVSELLWRKVKPKLSAGRVQSVAVRLIVQRERERQAFKSATWWDLLGMFAAAVGSPFQAEMVTYNGQRLPLGKDFDSATGKIKDPSLYVMNEQQARDLADLLKKTTFKVQSLEERKEEQRPYAPFTTSALQQEANRKLGMSSKECMRVAQSLYENGYITYMRTDSTTLAQVAIDAARDLVRSEYGPEFLPERPRTYDAKSKNAQEAHEAIRPAGHPFRLPEALKGELDPQQFRLFDLIWKRTIASQMENARLRRITLVIEGGGATFRASGKIIDFPGYLRAYVEGSDDPEAELADRESLLPAVKTGDPLTLKDLEPKSHTTQPPARYTEASLIEELEKRGIGRPSTYAAIIEKITQEYINRKGKALVPTWLAFSVVRLLEDHLPDLVDYNFTAQMEDDLDAISRGEANRVNFLQQFYFGDDSQGLKHKLDEKLKDVDPRTISRFSLGTPESGLHREEVFVRVGKYGPFLEQGDRKGSIPDDMAPDELTLEKAMTLLEQSKGADTPLGTGPEGKPVYVKNGRFGPYVQLGTKDDEEKPKMSSIPKNMDPRDVTLEFALKLLELPRNLGKHPELGEDIIAKDGKFGPYISCGKETRSLPPEMPPTDVTFEQAIELLKQPKTRGRGRAAPKEPLRTFDKSPVTGEPIKLLDGRYGMYLTDTVTNATVRNIKPEDLTFEQAVSLLAERAAAGPSPKAKRKAAKKAAKKATPVKVAKKAAKKAAKQPQIGDDVDAPF